MRKVILSATQMACDWNVEENVNKAEKLIREAAKQGANIVLIQELFETPYFPIDMDEICLYREDWGVFRDRRPARYGALMTMDGESI